MDLAERAEAASRARTWADILRHMDSAGEAAFCGCTHGAPARGYLSLLWEALRDQYGAEPVTFYPWPEQAPDSR